MHWCGARTEDQCQTLEQTLPKSEACIASCGSAIFEGSAEFPEKSLFALAVSRGPRPYVNGTARCAKMGAHHAIQARTGPVCTACRTGLSLTRASCKK